VTGMLRFPEAVKHEPAIDVWLETQAAELGAIARKWFVRMRECGSDVRELMHDGCPTACVDDAAFAYVSVFRAHANVGFFHGAQLEDSSRLLEGSGKRMRHVKVRPGVDLDAAGLEALVANAYADIRRRLAVEHRDVDARAPGMATPDVAGRRKRLVALCSALPEALAERCGVQHLAFKVRKRIFAYYTYDHHGDGRIAFLCKAPAGEQGRLIRESPSRYFFPPYVGAKGWVGLRLDTRAVDWTAVKNLAFAAYFLTAPDSVRRQSMQATVGKPKGSRRRRPTGRR
jgi:hypothetical protein